MPDAIGYTEPEAARILGVSPRTLQRYRKNCDIGYHRSPGGRIRYTLDQLSEFKERCRVNAAN